MLILVVLNAIAIAVLAFFLHRPLETLNGKKNSVVSKEVIGLILILIALYDVIFFLFYFQVGMQPSIASNNSSNSVFELTTADWLSFLGDYLGFGGALVLGWFVYGQSRLLNDQSVLLNEQNKLLNEQTKKINELTLAEYSTSFQITIEGCCDSNNRNLKNSLISTYVDASGTYSAYSFSCVPKKDSGESSITGVPNQLILLRLKIQNIGKTPIEGIAFKTIEFIPFLNKNNSLLFEVESRERDPSAGRIIVLPNQVLYRHFVFEGLLENSFNAAFLRLSISDNRNNISSSEIMVRLKDGILYQL